MPSPAAAPSVAPSDAPSPVSVVPPPQAAASNASNATSASNRTEVFFRCIASSCYRPRQPVEAGKARGAGVNSSAYDGSAPELLFTCAPEYRDAPRFAGTSRQPASDPRRRLAFPSAHEMGGRTYVATKRRDPVPAQQLAEQFRRIEANVATVIEGKPEVIRLALIALLAEGHLLIEDVPGVGKTLLAKAVAKSIACSVRRVQFTPDLLPSDITGVSVFNQEHGDFEFKPGAIFANIVLGDEINRAGPKTQSAMLEAMEERTVTVDGTTYELGVPFMVIATQNPIELEGTYPLPEAQRDRFMMRVSIGYPSVAAELEVLEVHGQGDRVADLEPVTDAQQVAALIDAAKTLHAAEPLQRYIVELVRASRTHPAVELGASPRASLALLRAARAQAACEGRDYVVPDDVKGLAQPVLAHRLILSPEATMADRTAAQVIDELLASVPLPAAGAR